MNQKTRSSIWGPLAIASGGTFVVWPILLYAQMLYDGRLSFPYQDVASGMMMIVSIFVFLGLLIASMGLQLILTDKN